MTLDEAIKHAEEVADTCEYEASRYDMSDSYESYVACKELECAKEQRQIAAWLKELKQLREQTRWIPVTAELPKDGGDYLTTISFDIGAKEPVREVYKDFFCILSQKWLNHNEDVIAWMPLPQSYKVDMKNNTRSKGESIEGYNESYNCENWIP